MRLRRWRALAALGVAGAAAACMPAPPEGTTRDDVAFFEEAAATVGCRLETDAEFRAVEFQAALTRQQVLDIAAQELAAGRAERLEGGGIVLIAGPCEPGAEPPMQPLQMTEVAE